MWYYLHSCLSNRLQQQYVEVFVYCNVDCRLELMGIDTVYHEGDIREEGREPGPDCWL